MVKNKTVLITGCSSGFGKITAGYLSEKGYKVIATTRKELDVTWSMKKITNAIKKLGTHIDVLVNNAGYAQLGMISDVSEDQVNKQFATNVFGLLKVTKAVLPIMRKQKSGLIINVSSVSGFFSNPHGGIYAASKYAVEALTQALRVVEEEGNNIVVCSVNPGPFNTNFWQTAKADAKTNSLVDKNMGRRENPIIFAKTIEKIIASPHPGPRYMVGVQATLMRLTYRLVPDFVIDWGFKAVYTKSLR